MDLNKTGKGSSAMRATFRPTRRYWLRRVVLPLLILLAVATVTIGLILIDTDSRVPLYGIGLTMFTLMPAAALLRNALLLATRYVLLVDKDGISGRAGEKEQFTVQWSDIIAAWVTDTDPHSQPYVLLGTSEGVEIVPLAPFGQDRVWQVVQYHVSSDALEADSQRKLPGHKDWITLREELRELVATRPLCVPDSHREVIVGWGGLAFFAAAAACSLWQKVTFATLVFAVLTVLGAILVLSTGSTEMDSEAVTRSNRISRRSMVWSEIKRVEFDAKGSRVVFRGDGRRLVVPSPRAWIGPDREHIWNWLLIQIDERQIDTRWK